MSCPTGSFEYMGECMDSKTMQFLPNTSTNNSSNNTTTSGSNGLPSWVLDIIKNADKIGAGVGAATGKGGSTAPPVEITTPPPTTTPAMPQWIWYVAGGVVLIVVFALMRKK